MVGTELRGAADEITAVLAVYSRQGRVGGKSESGAST